MKKHKASTKHPKTSRPKVKRYKEFIYLISAILVIIVFIFRSFSILHNETAVQKPLVSIINFGDVMFDRGVRNIIDNKGRDPLQYFKTELGALGTHDIFIANLEGPIVEMDRSLCQQKAYNFQFPYNTTERLKSIGINMVNMANNHSYDCYSKGYLSTMKSLSNAGIDYIGDKELNKSFVVKTINGKKVAFIGMDETVEPTPISSFYPLVKKLKSENDYVIVDIHWGTEYYLGHTALQESIAHSLINNGADVIFGGHPHVVEPMEIYKGGVVFYSEGNFVFDQDFDDTTVGLGAKVEFFENKKVFTLYPFNIRSFAPDLMKGSELGAFCEKYLKSVEHVGCSFELPYIN